MQLPFVPPDHRQIGAREKFRLVVGLPILFCCGQCREFSNRIHCMIVSSNSQPRNLRIWSVAIFRSVSPRCSGHRHQVNARCASAHILFDWRCGGVSLKRTPGCRSTCRFGWKRRERLSIYNVGRIDSQFRQVQTAAGSASQDLSKLL